MDYYSSKLLEVKERLVKVDIEKMKAALSQIFGVDYDTVYHYTSVRFEDAAALADNEIFVASFYFCGEKFFEIKEELTVEGKERVTLRHKYRILFGPYELGKN